MTEKTDAPDTETTGTGLESGGKTAGGGARTAGGGAHTADGGAKTAGGGAHTADGGGKTADGGARTADGSANTAGGSANTAGGSAGTPDDNDGKRGIPDLGVLRGELDEIDARLVELYEERMRVCGQVADYKIAAGKRVLDPEREKSKLASLKSLTHDEFNSKGVEELFEQIMAMSRKLQYRKLSEQGAIGSLPFIELDRLDVEGSRVVFQGAEGAYSQLAMMTYFGEDVNCFHVDTFRDAFAALDEGSADFAVLPIENSTAGAVAQIYDLLVEFESYVVGEQIIKIEHCLMGLPGSRLEDVRTVYSHPQSLMQSARFLNSHPEWKQISMQNNAFAAQKVLDDGDATQSAIASEQAAAIYGLKVLVKGVNQSEANRTRFIVTCNKKVFLRDASHVSLCFEVPHSSGSLYHMLSHFIYNDLNMTRIESRPIEDRDWEYRFFVEFDGNLSDPAVKNAIRGLREEARSLKVLGCF